MSVCLTSILLHIGNMRKILSPAQIFADHVQTNASNVIFAVLLSKFFGAPW